MISYMGVSKLASVAEEFRNPERDIPMGIFLSLAVAMVTYIVGLVIMIGVMPADELANTYTPAADAAAIIMGPTGRVVLSVAAVAAFISVANAGILSASRYPLAMARDHLIPVVFRRLGRFNTPVMAILLTGGMVLLQVVLMDPLVIAKYAGTTKMVLFGLLCVAVIVMRESGIHSYDPGFRTPLYPWIPLLGFFLSIAVIGFLKWEATVFAIGMVALGIVWFFWYARARVRRYGASPRLRPPRTEPVRSPGHRARRSSEGPARPIRSTASSPPPRSSTPPTVRPSNRSPKEPPCRSRRRPASTRRWSRGN